MRIQQRTDHIQPADGIGIELDEKYFNIACDRIEEAIREKEQLLF
jgi:hypothetical protein